jgi:nucleoid DNA-binding protein
MATKKKTAKKTAKKNAPMTKTQLLNALVDASDGTLTRKQVVGLMDSLATIGHKQLKKAGVFTMPGFAKFTVVKKAATKARKGVNPFTGEEMMFKAKPASKSVRARPIKACKDAVN